MTAGLRFLGDLPIGKIEAHEVKAQNPNAQRLIVASQACAAQIIEPAAAGFATVTLTVLLPVVTAIANDAGAGASGAANAARPAMLTDQLVTLVVIDQGGDVDELVCNQAGTVKPIHPIG